MSRLETTPVKDACTPLKVKCLLVDDLEENLLALAALLRSDEVEVLEAHSGAEALELLLLHDVALAFLDVQMPDMDGFQLAELMRGSERTRHIPIVFVTAGSRDQHRLFKGYESGAVDFLYKPIEPRILKNKAEVFFQLHRQKLQLAHDLRERTESLRLSELFVAVLGHDLRNPLNALLTSARLIELLVKDPEVRKVTDRMLSSGNRMSRMIDDMLDLARARLAGGIPIRREPVDLHNVVQRVIQEHKSATPAVAIELQSEGDPAGEWDADRLTQVVSNLLANAIQHGETSEPVRIVLDGTQGPGVTLFITNAGVIASELLPHVFNPFRGSERRFGRDVGLGLGLYIVQEIARSHGGTVCVESGAGNRTVFRVQLPR